MYELTEAHTAHHAGRHSEPAAQDPHGQNPHGENPPGGEQAVARTRRTVLVAVFALVVLAAIVGTLLVSLALTPVLGLVDRGTDQAVQVSPTDPVSHANRSTWSPPGAPTTTEEGRA
jgi:hypothetical protein